MEITTMNNYLDKVFDTPNKKVRAEQLSRSRANGTANPVGNVFQ